MSIIHAREGKDTMNLVCPHCKFGSSHSVSHIEDVIKEKKEIECVSCGNEFNISLEVPSKTYIRPELTEEDKRKAEENAKKLVKKWGFNNLPKMLAALCVENIRLVKEIQEHRAARGIDPLETFEV